MSYSRHTLAPGSQPHEHVGTLADGRQVLLTTRFGPVQREDGEHTQLTLLLFDTEGAVLSSDCRVLGPTSKLSASALEETLSATLAQLGPFTSGPIDIQPVPVALLGEPEPPLILTSEDEPGLSVTLSNSDGFFIPNWPFGGG